MAFWASHCAFSTPQRAGTVALNYRWNHKTLIFLPDGAASSAQADTTPRAQNASAEINEMPSNRFMICVLYALRLLWFQESRHGVGDRLLDQMFRVTCKVLVLPTGDAGNRFHDMHRRNIDVQTAKPPVVGQLP